ncbi:MAG: hypothetical protein DI598_08700 [Pseudopedobacter saltans]|uniref:Uncharacterized protein n=1 Tax=Pseudopedobacter saltans TaxID=151895 RepID=A0A2W5F477_9SPHI|nr:MAG: hypothetical protein DI598_08700 [Pseudopedobacter saltans]
MNMENTYDMEQMSNEERDFLLWRFFHKDLSEQESVSVQQMLDRNEDWLNAYTQLSESENQLFALDIEMPSMRFSKNVMEAIGAEHVARPVKSYINTKIIKALGWGFVTIIVACLVYAFSQVKWISNSSTESKPMELPKMPRIDVNWNFTQGGTWLYVFFAIVLVCIFVIVDKFLHSKRQYKTQQH